MKKVKKKSLYKGVKTTPHTTRFYCDVYILPLHVTTSSRVQHVTLKNRLLHLHTLHLLIGNTLHLLIDNTFTPANQVSTRYNRISAEGLQVSPRSRVRISTTPPPWYNHPFGHIHIVLSDCLGALPCRVVYLSP